MFVTTTPHSSSPDRPTPTTHRRHSSVADVSYEGAGLVRDGNNNTIDPWSQPSTAASPSTSRRSTYSRPPSIGSTRPTQIPSSNGFAQDRRPSKRDSGSSLRSPPLSPKKRASHSSSNPSSPSARSTNRSPPPIVNIDRVPTLPPLTYDVAFTSTTGAPITSGLISPGGLTAIGTDYVTSPSASIASQPPNRGSGPAHVVGSSSPLRKGTSAEATRFRTSPDNTLGVEASMSSKRLSMSRSQDANSENRRPSNSEGSDAARQKDRREQDKKTMLSKALQKAHTAVLLDNAQNFEGAIEAYSDACTLLQQVLLRSTGEEDRRKLDAIRTTYTNRITELQQLYVESQETSGKSLPRPPSNASHPAPATPRTIETAEEEEDDNEEAVIIETATMTRIVPDKAPVKESSNATERPPDAPSLPIRALQAGPPSNLQDPTINVPRISERFLSIESPMDANYAPPPLSPRRVPTSNSAATASDQLQLPQHTRGDSGNSISWLDTIDESGGSSCASSFQSRTRRELYQHVRMPSGDTEAEFDAALDAAVEAAYDDGEAYDYDETPFLFNDNRASEPAKAMVDNERKRLSDREQVIQAAHSRTRELRKKQETFAPEQDQNGVFDDDAAEEERMLYEMSKDFGFDFDLQSKPAPPRTSDSSGYSGNTWHSSVSSSRTTALSSLSTVAEVLDASLAAAKANPNLPRLSEEGNQNETLPADNIFSTQKMTTQTPGSVRSRRMSGTKQLKIETSINPSSRTPLTQFASTSTTKSEPGDVVQPTTTRPDLQLLPDTVFKPPGSASYSTAPQGYGAPLSPLSAPSPAGAGPTHSPATPAVLQLAPTESESPKPESKSLSHDSGTLKKNQSSISLNTRNLSMSSPDGSEEASIGTPLSTTFSAFSSQSRKPLPRPNDLVPPTPSIVASFADLPGTTSINIFESNIHSPYVPGSPNPLAANAPIPLEACPDSHLLRPFWLMRCFYQTIAHPRGGYLSTKLFVPRDVWRVKGVKIKGVEDKIANCDFLTAALLKLASVDTLDADAVLDEMQALELVLDQVQGNLAKRLGGEVGVQGVSALFKDASVAGGDGAQSGESSSTSSRAVSQGKSYLSSWRKLRSKSSAVNLTALGKDQSKDAITMSTLPMTSLPNPRFAKRDVSQLELSGPHAAYMSSLSRLFDAVQIIDQVARQVEDPGLKLSSPTHVGLELCTRHASEFFGFYVCRFVLTDLTMLLDKFIKRGSEWVLV